MRPALDHASVLPIGSLMATMVLLNEAAIVATPCGTFLRSLRLPAARRPPAGAGVAAFRAVAIASRPYFFVAFFLPAIAPLRGPLRVRAFVCVRCPRTGSP